jgi:hypothetical protein
MAPSLLAVVIAEIIKAMAVKSSVFWLTLVGPYSIEMQ